MPKVGRRKFPYTKSGAKAAIEYAEKTGKRLEKKTKSHKKRG